MISSDRAEAALSALRELQVPEAAPQVEARRRRQGIDQLEHLRGQLRAVRRRRWFTLSAVAAAFAVAAVAFLILGRGGDATPSSATARQPHQSLELAEGSVEQRIDTGSQVKTAEGSSAQLRTALGARIAVTGASALRLADGQEPGEVERVELERGSIAVKVPKLGAQRQFRVSTPDTLVIVHGTEFTVTVHSDKNGRTNTVVEVKSGQVEVRKKQLVQFLNAGAAWSSQAPTAAPKAQEAPGPRAKAPEPVAADGASNAPKLTAAGARGKAATSGSKGSSADRAGQKEPPSSSGDLARANALLTSALKASQSGNDELAVTRLDELLSRYPNSPVADNARVERFRALKRLGREREAARAASGYLKNAPDGLARDEARALGK